MLGWENSSIKKTKKNIPINSPKNNRVRYPKLAYYGINPCVDDPSTNIPRDVPIIAPISWADIKTTAIFHVNLDYFLIKFMNVTQGLKLAPHKYPEIMIPKRREIPTWTSIPSVVVHVSP